MNCKDRVTLMLCTNAAGEKAPILMIGKSARPRSLKNVKTPVVYDANKKGWMTVALATKWFKDIFVPFKRKLLGSAEPAVLLWDNHSSHSLDKEMLKQYRDIHIIFLPPNLTSHHQPLDAGIIAATKLRYKTTMVQMLNDVVDHWEERRDAAEHNKSGTNGLLQGHYAHLGDAVMIIDQAWGGITDETIQNCWIKANCLPAGLQEQLMKTSDKGRAKIAARATTASSGVAAMATDEDESWEVMDSGQLDFSTLREALGTLSVNIQAKRPDLMAGNGTIFPVLQDAAYSAADVGLDSDSAARTAAAKTITSIEEDDEMVEALGQMMMEELDNADCPPPPAPQGDVEAAAAAMPAAATTAVYLQSEEEQDFEHLRTGRAAAEDWLRDLAALAGCSKEVGAVLAASKKYFDSKKTTQKSLHAFFSKK